MSIREFLLHPHFNLCDSLSTRMLQVKLMVLMCGMGRPKKVVPIRHTPNSHRTLDDRVYTIGEVPILFIA